VAQEADFRTRDDVDETFAEAVVHRRSHKVLGFRLRPFSFWHAANLDFVESPFAGHNKKIDFGELLIAAKTCRLLFPRTLQRHPFEKIVDLLKARKYRPIKAKFNELKRGDLSNVKLPLMQEVAKFCAYLRDYSERPEYMTREESVPVKTPWYLFEVAMFKRYNPHLTWAQCWDMPIGEASWYNAAMLEATGTQIDLVTPEYRKAFRQIGYID
jgi:hypothetical protein